MPITGEMSLTSIESKVIMLDENVGIIVWTQVIDSERQRIPMADKITIKAYANARTNPLKQITPIWTKSTMIGTNNNVLELEKTAENPTISPIQIASIGERLGFSFASKANDNPLRKSTPQIKWSMDRFVMNKADNRANKTVGKAVFFRMMSFLKQI